MALREFTNKNAVQLLSTQSRKADISPVELCQLHYEMGKYLAYEMLDEFELTEVDIQHVQGQKKGVELANKGNISIVALMRAGLYAAEGMRSIFRDCQFLLYNGTKIDNGIFENRTVIIVDAVINTGRSIVKTIEELQIQKPSKIIVATLIMQHEAVELVTKYENISFYAMRVSKNKYTGIGGTDTGNRLFNTKAE